MSMFLSLQSADTKNLSLEEASENLRQFKCMSIGVEVKFISYKKRDNNNDISDNESHENSLRQQKKKSNKEATAYLNINNKKIAHTTSTSSLPEYHPHYYDHLCNCKNVFLSGKIFFTSNHSELWICCDKHNIPMPVAVVHQHKCIYRYGQKISFFVEVEQFTNWIICEIFVHLSPAITLTFSKVWVIPCIQSLFPNGIPGGSKCKLGFYFVGVIIAVVMGIPEKKGDTERRQGFDKIMTNCKLIFQLGSQLLLTRKK